jgi:hypothetical protein
VGARRAARAAVFFAFADLRPALFAGAGFFRLAMCGDLPMDVVWTGERARRLTSVKLGVIEVDVA